MLWIKAFHIVCVVCWFSGIFYLPRLFVYHAEASDAISTERFKIMERRLYYGITTPSMILTLLFGLWLVSYNLKYYLQAPWFHTKAFLVIILIFYHVLCGIYLKQFKEDNNRHSAKYYRFFNEFPVFILIAVTILVVVKPF